MGRSFRLSDIDWFLLGLALAIAAIGVVEIYSTTLHSALAGQYRKQIYWLFSVVFWPWLPAGLITTWSWSKSPGFTQVRCCFWRDFWWRGTPLRERAGGCNWGP